MIQLAFHNDKANKYSYANIYLTLYSLLLNNFCLLGEPLKQIYNLAIFTS